MGEFRSDNGFVAIMNHQGNCRDNTVVKLFCHTLKTEHVYWRHYQARSEAATNLFDYSETGVDVTRIWDLKIQLNMRGCEKHLEIMSISSREDHSAPAKARPARYIPGVRRILALYTCPVLVLTFYRFKLPLI